MLRLGLGRKTGDGLRRPVGELRIRKTERFVLVSLGLLAAVFLLVAILTKPGDQRWNEWVSNLSLGFVAAITASLLTFLLIDMVLARQREAQSHESYEEERRNDLLASLRRGELERNRSIVEQLRAAGWFKDGFLRNADFSGADLQGIDFDGTDLAAAQFRGAGLRRATFRNANVSGACFAHADLRGARFDGADTTGVDLTMCTKDDDTVI